MSDDNKPSGEQCVIMFQAAGAIVRVRMWEDDAGVHQSVQLEGFDRASDSITCHHLYALSEILSEAAARMDVP